MRGCMFICSVLGVGGSKYIKFNKSSQEDCESSKSSTSGWVCGCVCVYVCVGGGSLVCQVCWKRGRGVQCAVQKVE